MVWHFLKARNRSPATGEGEEWEMLLNDEIDESDLHFDWNDDSENANDSIRGCSCYRGVNK
jgi:hypothetical protein